MEEEIKETILCLPLSLSVHASLNTCNVLSDDMKYKKRNREGPSLSQSHSVCLFVCLSLSCLNHIYVLVSTFHYTKHVHVFVYYTKHVYACMNALR